MPSLASPASSSVIACFYELVNSGTAVVHCSVDMSKTGYCAEGTGITHRGGQAHPHRAPKRISMEIFCICHYAGIKKRTKYYAATGANRFMGKEKQVRVIHDEVERLGARDQTRS